MVENRVNALRERHGRLDVELMEERLCANQNELRIRDIKRRKLSIKDEIERLSGH